MHAETGPAGPFNTGLAIANPNNQTANVSVLLADVNGSTHTTSVMIAANGLYTENVGIILAGLGGGFAFSGAITLSSDVPVAVFGFRYYTDGHAATNLPVFELSAPAVTTLVLPHWTNGGGSTSEIVLVNSGESVLTGTVEFLDGSGAAVTLTANAQTTSSFGYSIPANSSFKLVTDGSPSSATVGSARVTPADGMNTPAAFAILSYLSAGSATSQVTPIPASGSALRAYVETAGTPGVAGSMDSQISIANTSAMPGSVKLELTDTAGHSLAAAATVDLAANGQADVNLLALFTGLPAATKGVLRISSATLTLSVAAQRMYINPSGQIIASALPVSNENAVGSSSPMYFPIIFDGTGYFTQMDLFSGVTDQSTTGQLRFVKQDGTPWTLNILPYTPPRRVRAQLTSQ
jgi:hypothetical protein